MIAIAAKPIPLLDQLTTTYGPPDLLGRFFLHADTEARARGVSLSFAGLDELIAVNEENRDSWLPLFPTYDIRYNAIAPNEAFCILGRDARGRVVAAHAGRLFNLRYMTFHELAESLRLMYEDPERSKRPGETCVVTAKAAKAISGRVVFSGAAWYHPDYRGKQLSTIVPILSRAYAYTRWNCDYLVAMMSEGVVRGGMTQRTGYTNIDWDICVTNSPLGDVRFAFMWMQPEQLLQDVARFVARFGVEHAAHRLAQRRA
ncbi:MAG TPA: hypothetical protein VFA64_12605 [Hyphomicrobiaceae bacterium]|nr:hypothetical protein [Hyphomicrobiaceae bacterium]